MNKIAALLRTALFLVGVLTVTISCSGQEKKGTQTAEVDNTGSGAASLSGKPAPNFITTTLDDEHVSLANYKGKALVINFWATWCEACRQEMPWLAEVREKYRGQGFEVLGIVTDNAGLKRIAAVVKSYGVKYPILYCNHITAQAYGGLSELPVSFFINRHGKVVATMTGADSKEAIEVQVKKSLKNYGEE